MDDVKDDAGNVEEGVTEEPTPEPTPEPAPEPAPIPDPDPVSPSNDDGRIAALEGLVATLADTVAKLIPTDEPVREHKIPWTHLGGR